MTPMEAWRQIESLGPLAPLTAAQKRKSRNRQKDRSKGKGPRTYVMTQQALQDMWWVVDNVEGLDHYCHTIHEALAAYARLCRALIYGDAFSPEAIETLEHTAAANGCSHVAVADWAVRYMAQELRKGPLHLDPPHHNDVESRPG